MPSIAVATLGCKVNQHEAEGMRALFGHAGYHHVDFNDRADVYLVHTCTVTEDGDRKSRQMIRQAARQNPNGFVVVTGCYAQRAPEELAALPGVRLVVGNRDRTGLVDLVNEALYSGKFRCEVWDLGDATFEELPAEITSGRTRATLKIQEGCRSYCSYCIVPTARGPLRSMAPDRVLELALKVASDGFRELVLTGVHLGTYGTDLEQRTDLASLLARLEELKPFTRIRLGSMEPMDVTPELLALAADSEVLCPHWHIPLQSGSDRILKVMNRRYTTDEYAALIWCLRANIPNVTITTDVIVGFPGETREMFEQSMGFIKRLRFSKLHVFPYSRRTGTPAASFPGQLAKAEKDARTQEMISLGKELFNQVANQYIGQTVEVLVEQVRPDTSVASGLTSNYLRVHFPCETDLVGRIVSVELKQVGDQVIFAEPK